MSGNELLVLLSLADNASDEGYCFPSWENIMKKTKVSRTTLSRVLNSLELKGHIRREMRKRENGSNRSNSYWVEPKPQFQNETLPQFQNETTPSFKMKPLEPSLYNRQKDLLSEPQAESDDTHTATRRKKPKYDAVDMELAQYLLAGIRLHHETYKQPDLAKWADNVRMMRERDGREVESIRNVITAIHYPHKWNLPRSFDAEFWRPNIRSTDKLRKQYDTIALQLKARKSA